MGCVQNYGPLWVIDHFTAPKFSGYQNGTPIFGTTHMPLQAVGLLVASWIDWESRGTQGFTSSVESYNAKGLQKNYKVHGSL